MLSFGHICLRSGIRICRSSGSTRREEVNAGLRRVRQPGRTKKTSCGHDRFNLSCSPNRLAGGVPLRIAFSYSLTASWFSQPSTVAGFKCRRR